MKRAVAGLLLAAAALAAGAFEIQGHRGARGLLPENTLASFERALLEGAQTLELDVMLTADGVAVVHHDPALNPDLARDPAGRWPETTGPLLRSLTLAQLQAWDVGRVKPGSRTARDFPQQQAADGQRVPTLKQVLALGTPATRFNIEIKLDPREPEKYAPAEALVDAVVQAVREAGAGTRALVQSFNWSVLQRAQQVAPELHTSYLTIQRPNANTVANPAWMAGYSLAAQGSVPKMVKAAGGRWWAPHFRDLTAEQVREAQALGLKVAVWTVNEAEDIARMQALGVDAVITDYPDRARAVRR